MLWWRTGYLPAGAVLHPARLGKLRAGTSKADRHAPETDEQREVIARRAQRPA